MNDQMSLADLEICSRAMRRRVNFSMKGSYTIVVILFPVALILPSFYNHCVGISYQRLINQTENAGFNTYYVKLINMIIRSLL